MNKSLIIGGISMNKSLIIGGISMNKSLYIQMKDFEKSLVSSIEQREHAIEQLPVGKLNCCKNRTYYTWYLFEKKNGITIRSVIPKKNRQLAEMLAERAYHESALSTERKQLRAIRMFLRYFDNAVPGEKYISSCPEHRKLLCNIINLDGYSNEDLSWMNCERPQPQPFQESTIVPTVAGYKVKSKSEAEYVSALVNHHLVFRYEWPLQLLNSNTIAWPDFTVKHPLTGSLIYIEHFGLMDDPNYVKKNAVKLHNYLLDGIVPGKNLFISYESKLDVFTSLDAEAMIQKIFFE